MAVMEFQQRSNIKVTACAFTPTLFSIFFSMMFSLLKRQHMAYPLPEQQHYLPSKLKPLIQIIIYPQMIFIQ